MALLDIFSKKEKKEPKEELAPPPPPMPELPALPETISVPSATEHLEELEAPEPIQLEEYHKAEPTKMPAEEPVILEEEMPEERIIPEREGPLFVSVQDYQAILDSLTSMKVKLNEADSSFERINKVRAEQKQKFDQWRKSLEDVQKKLTYVDEVLFGKV